MRNKYYEVHTVKLLLTSQNVIWTALRLINEVNPASRQRHIASALLQGSWNMAYMVQFSWKLVWRLSKEVHGKQDILDMMQASNYLRKSEQSLKQQLGHVKDHLCYVSFWSHPGLLHKRLQVPIVLLSLNSGKTQLTQVLLSCYLKKYDNIPKVFWQKLYEKRFSKGLVFKALFTFCSVDKVSSIIYCRD